MTLPAKPTGFTAPVYLSAAPFWIELASLTNGIFWALKILICAAAPGAPALKFGIIRQAF